MSQTRSSFGTRLRNLREAAGLSQTAFGRIICYHPSLISKIETGVEHPSRMFAQRADEALDADGSLLALAGPVRLTPDDDERLILAARTPSRVDPAVVESLGTVLAGQRLVDDIMGSGPLLRPVTAQLATVERLVTDARGPVRPLMLRCAQQWAQFAGWLHLSAGKPDAARHWFATGMEWATEIADKNMLATVLSFRGHAAWLAGQVGPTISLSAAARRMPGVFAGQLAYDAQQEARGHAMAGDRQTAERLCEQAAELADSERAGLEYAPPWQYYRSPSFFALERGLVYRYLGRDHPLDNQRAIDLLRSGLDGLPAAMRSSEWCGEYLYHLALAHLQAGDHTEAGTVLTDMEAISSATRAAPLVAKTRTLRRHLHSLPQP
ncbi:MAG TPA: helix-turn-helix domain-containing protein [Mycobacteriales bacterium]